MDRVSPREPTRRAVRKALLRHKQLGLPIVSWEGGKVVVIPPEEIPLDELEQK